MSTTICNRNTHEEHNIFLVLSSNCFSITLNQFDGNFNRHHGCMNWDVCNYNLIINSTSEQVCFYDWNPQLTNTVVHFMCTTHNQDSSPIYNLLYSHEIIAGKYSILIMNKVSSQNLVKKFLCFYIHTRKWTVVFCRTKVIYVMK